MTKFQEFLITLLTQLVALMPLWYFVWHFVQRMRKLEERVTILTDINNHRAYYAAKKTIARYENETLMNQDELKEYADAKLTIEKFEKEYKVNDNPENN